MCRILCLRYCLIICCVISWSRSSSPSSPSSPSSMLDNGNLLLPANFTQKLKLIDYTSRIFCNSQVKVVNVYFENETSLSYPGQILKVFNDCGISHVSIRNKFKKSKLNVLKDDGILMYLIMILRDITQTIKFNLIRKKSASKHLTYIILMIDDSETITEQWLYHTFESFWNLWILNVAIVFYRADMLHIYRYDVFRQQLFPTTITHGDHRVHIHDIFPRAMLNMRQRPLRMCMYHDGVRSILEGSGAFLGSDGLMSTYLTERLNATRIVDRVKMYGNISISQDICFKEIVEEKDDISVNIRFLSLATFYNRAEHTVVHSRDDLCVMVPKAKVASSFWNLFRAFEYGVWLLIIFSLTLACAFCYFMYRPICSRKKLCLQLYACLISMPFSKLRKPTSLRVFLCVWLIYGMLISAAFKGNLTGNLVNRQYLPDVNTIKELAESPYLLATLPRHVKHLHRYIDEKNYYGSVLKQKMVITPDLQFKHLISTNNQTFGYLQKKHLSLFNANSRQHTYKGRPLYHVMRQCIVPFHAVYILPYGSPYLGYINTLIRNAQEFGYINYWDRMMSAAFRSSRRRIRGNGNSEDEPEVLELDHFQAAFFLLFFGLILAFIFFICEIFNLEDAKKAFIRFKIV